MSLPWSPVVFVDIVGSILMLLISCACAITAWKMTRERPDDVFRNYIFLFTVAILFFAVSRSFGHLFKQLLVMHDMHHTWEMISPYSGAVNTTAFVVIFAFGISFQRFQSIHSEIEYYKSNLEDLITVRTEELEKSRNTLQNILNNSNPINITTINFDLVQANEAYYALWPAKSGRDKPLKCYESRPGDHCDTDDCPLKLIIEGSEEVVQEVTKNLDGVEQDFIITARPFRDLDGKLLGMVESFQDITLRKQAERAMRDSEMRFRTIFESSPDPVILAKLQDGAIIDVNRAFEEATGMEKSAVRGHNSEELGLWAIPAERKTFRRIMENRGEVNNFEAEFKVYGGESRTGLISASAFTINAERCMLLVIRDITTEKKAERALIEMDKMKSEFISTAAHELSTPLSSMMGYTEFLRSQGEFGDFTEEQKRDFINEIHDNGEALSRIIEDLLDISRIESGKPIPLILADQDILELLHKRSKAFMVHKTRHRLRLELPDKPQRPTLLIDGHRINQALENLLSNAVKYSPEDTEVTLKAVEQDRGWEISVTDQGVGMSTEQIRHVFDKFYRADASDTAISGLGLGMSIVKQVIKAHRGTINVVSAPGKGTMVTFFLPFERQRAKT